MTGFAAATLHGLLDERAVESPEALACRFLADGDGAAEILDCATLARRSRALGAALLRQGARGAPVVIAHPSGPRFIESLFACWHAGAIAVPAHPARGARHRRRLEAIVADSGAKLALAATEIPGVRRISASSADDDADFPEVDPAATCLLQYTSGSTAEPKGVRISHANFRSHATMLKARGGSRVRSVVSWLPPWHDMGLVLKILHSFEIGAPLTFFPPERFLETPARWLRAISEYRADLSGAPDFAYELCLRSISDEEIDCLDLSCWTHAACGAERVRADTLDRFARRFERAGFRREAFVPGYGLAEATLIVASCAAGKAPKRSAGGLVSNGAPLPGIRVKIVDPATERESAQGEIRIKGPGVTAGYWNRPQETRGLFDTGGWLRTGDLGFLQKGELFVNGRLKDLIVIHGENRAPEDIEAAIRAELTEITAAAAFSSESDGREIATVAIEATGLPVAGRAELCAAVRRISNKRLEIPIGRVVVVRAGLLPRTTSGKIQRNACRELISCGRLKLDFDDSSDLSANIQPANSNNRLDMVLEIVSEILGHSRVNAEDDAIGMGMASVEVTRLAARLRERTGTCVSIGEILSARSFTDVASLVGKFPENRDPLLECFPGEGGLSHAQERMWFLHRIDPSSAACHVFGCVELAGALDPDRLEKSIQAVVRNHEILRSRHDFGADGPKVRVDEANVRLERIVVDNDAELSRMLSDFADRPFNLSTDSPVRVCLVSRGPDRAALGFCAHHIVADGWSMRILAREVAEAYAGKTISPPATTYLDYARAHRRWIDGDGAAGQIEWWKSRLAGHSGALPLATDFPRPPTISARGGSVERTLPAGLCQRISELARERRATPFMVHLAIYLLLLRRHGAGDDAIVAVPVANRNHAAAENLIGTLVNTLPFRLPLDPAETFGELLARVREAVFEMQAAQDAPFEKIVDAVRAERGNAPLAQVMFDHQELPLPERWAEGLECRPLAVHRGAVQFDLSLLLTDFGNRQQLALEYRADLFRRETAEAMLERYLYTANDICRTPELPLAAISLLTAADEEQLATWESGPYRPGFLGKTALESIAARCARHPLRVAVSLDGRALDYREIASRSDSLAAALRTSGIGRGDQLAVLLRRDADLPVALLAIWKAGAAYVPLDAANPPERLRQILEDQAPIRVLVSPELAGGLPAGTATIPLVEEMLASGAGFRPVPISAADPAYAIYTSGSTGRPKGVVVSHGALANFLFSMAEAPGFTEADKLLAVTTISFDIAGLELFLPLVMGGCIELVSSETARDGAALAERMRDSRATVMQATPATWRMLLDAGWRGSPDLKILCGGEAIDTALAAKLRICGCQLWNLYGPTETTIWSTLWRVPTDFREISIGRPIANTGVHVLAADGTPTPPGVPGELWISGAGLAEGYWNRPDLTDAAFVTGAAGVRRYRTGDFARWRPDGTLECLGRADGQVKIRGFRVELGEIEAALAAHPQVTVGKVALRGGVTDCRIVAWIQPAGDAPELPALREFLAARLPAYMLPAEIGVVADFPLNASGKIDISRLPDPAPIARPIAAPFTGTERRLAEIWSDLLGRPVTDASDDWFHSGGHSLLALRLFARIHKDFRREIALSAILTHSTLGALAAAIDRSPDRTT